MIESKALQFIFIWNALTYNFCLKYATGLTTPKSSCSQTLYLLLTSFRKRDENATLHCIFYWRHSGNATKMPPFTFQESLITHCPNASNFMLGSRCVFETLISLASANFSFIALEWFLNLLFEWFSNSFTSGFRRWQIGDEYVLEMMDWAQ